MQQEKSYFSYWCRIHLDATIAWTDVDEHLTSFGGAHYFISLL